MGGGRWDNNSWDAYSSKNVTSKRTVDDIYTAKKITNTLDPKGIKVRESVDSADNPLSTPLIVALDVTGSMGAVLDSVARNGLKTLATEVYNRRPISDPHIMFMAVGDVHAGDSAPLQVTQFEADIRIAEQLSQLYLERGGGGNDFEGYLLPWYFAAMHTTSDSLNKRGKKGYLFTIGDEEPTPSLTKRHIETVFGETPDFDEISQTDLLTMVSRQYEVYHLIMAEGSHYRTSGDKVKREWTNLLGERAIILKDHTKLAEVIVSILQRDAGVSVDTIVDSWNGTTGLVVAEALKGGKLSNVTNSKGVVTFD